MDTLLEAFVEYAHQGGFEKALGAPKKIVISDDGKGAWRNTMSYAIDAINQENRLNQSGKCLQSLIAVIPHHPQKLQDRVYREVKDVCSVTRAIISQCILEKHTAKKHVINGVLRQLFVKMGSIPWKIRFRLPFGKLAINIPTMVMGINVNHAQKCNTSVVGVSASFDRDYVRYYSKVIHQKHKQECIEMDDLIPEIVLSLEYFKETNECLPVQVIVYRDGISETQIEEAVNKEVAAFEQVLAPKGIKFEFIAVQKRVNARFLISSNLQSAPPGTAINDVVVSNQFWDFYIVPSKPPPKCVAIPTRFIVIKDGLGLSDADGKGEMDLMHFSNSLCSLYFNWPGPTRVPAPIKYAQKIAQQYCQTLTQQHPHYVLDGSYHFL